MHVVARRFPLIALLVLALALVACGGSDKKNDDTAGSATGLNQATTSATPGTETPSTTATPAGLPEPAMGAILERVIIPSLNVDAPIETRGINARGEMEDPTGKDAVAWYDFSEFPGFGGNAVFSGHVDWYTGELGPFGRMKELKDGDDVLFRLSDGMELKYKVTQSTLYESAKAPVQEIVARTEKDSVTFITCEGTFNRAAQEYSHPRVVRAERVG
jgi:LPXTG-site transpeptidase (sortase) family protein